MSASRRHAAQGNQRLRPHGVSRPEAAPLYVRECFDCGVFQVSEDPRFLLIYLPCPECGVDLVDTGADEHLTIEQLLLLSELDGLQ